MKKNTFFVFGMLAVLLTFGVALTACSGKKDSGGGSGSSGGGSASAPSVGKAAPASDFTYDATEDGKGVIIKAYTGKGGKLVIPAEIEGLPVVELGKASFYGEDNSSYGPGRDLTSVVIPASVKKIGSRAFNRCENLASVTIQGSGVALEVSSFSNCTELAELVIPDGETVLIPYVGPFDNPKDPPGSYSFDGCKKLPLAMRARLKAMGFAEI